MPVIKKRNSFYGKLHVEELSNEVKHLWYTKDKDFDELPKHRWSWQHQTDMSFIDDIDYLKKLITMSKLNDQEDCALASWIDGAAMRDIAEDMNISSARAGQVIAKALRKIRHYVKFLGKFEYYACH